MVTIHQCIPIDEDIPIVLDNPVYFVRDSDFLDEHPFATLEGAREVDDFLEQTQVYPRSEVIQNLIQALQFIG